MMTKKDYIQFAQAIKDARVAIDELHWTGNRALGMLDIFRADNRNFDANRFLAASTPEEVTA